MDDQQRARELLLAEFNEDAREAFLRGGFDAPVCVTVQSALRAITAALRAAPEVTDGAVDRAAKALHANGADSITSDTPWSELHDGEVNQFRSWARAALLAARPQGVKDDVPR